MSSGRLVLVGTPIGNLGDLTPRAVEALAAADLVCCEDTRRTGRLLQHAGIRAAALRVVNDHTEEAAVADVVSRLQRGEVVAVVSDAGMPGISDPGERLAAAAIEADVAVEVVPGPSAAITGLVASGLPAGRFVFEGFLPRKGSGRTARLAELAGERRTVVLYEAPHRVARTLADLVDVCGADRRVVLARELTKLYEEVRRGTLDQQVHLVVRPLVPIVLAAHDRVLDHPVRVRPVLGLERLQGLPVRGRLVGLPLQGSAHRAQAARGRPGRTSP